MSKFAIDIQHIDFYKEHGFLEIENLISPALLEVLSLDLLDYSPDQSRYLSRKHDAFQKVIKNKSIKNLALELTSKSLLKHGLDMLITIEDKEKHKDPVYFRQLFSYTGIALGLCINLSSDDIAREENNSEHDCLFPSKRRSGTFFQPSKAIDFSYLTKHEKQLLILFCYTDSRYKLNPLDPFAHDVKNEGMSFGDKLSDKYHPLIYS